ncbi:hypothetical protein DERP_009953 [Dermatophagoides pteronyssinus]|uniref:NADH dehydrogenase [ubiquinone] flavoprotein 3, mitochondrial n=1 Tax=Dermatophagoides pteronyssinus TaxID=6956 RepID=A0ABQ8J243_DERPT|nr:hypothetical protein DERP_009953 [Dermatophagoides pteronyssinus]
MIIRRNLTSFTRVVYNTAAKSGGQSGSASSSNKKKTTAKITPSPPPPQQQSSKAEPEEQFRNDQYNCPEYYQHDRFSFFELIDRMADKRLPQKSNKEMY